MKRISLFGNLFIALMAIFIYSSCDTTDNTSAPVLELKDDGTGTYLTTDADVAAGSWVNINLVGTAIENPLTSVKFYEDGNTITDYANRLTYDGQAAWANPASLNGATDFDWVVGIQAHSDLSEKTYMIELTDEAGGVDQVSFRLNTDQGVTYPGPLSIDYVSGTGCFVADATLDTGTPICFTLEGVRGSDAALYTLTVLQDGVAIDNMDRLTYNGLAFGSNPTLLPVDSENGFIDTIGVVVHFTEGVTRAYTFQLEDAAGNIVETSAINITTNTNGTAISNTLTAKLLYNQAGPAGKGALDLDFGYGTGVTSSSTDADPIDAEIRDMGNDNNGNWLRQVAPMNDATMRRVPPSSELPITFDNVVFKEEIQEAYDHVSATEVTLGAPAGVVVGDQFVLQRGGVYYLIECTNINDVAGNADDYYELKIKY